MESKTLLIETETETIPCHLYENGELEIIHSVDEKGGSGLTSINLKDEQSRQLYSLLKTRYEF